MDISMFGKVSVGPLQTFEVRQNPPGEAWRRLVAIDGKPLAAAELARRDAEHERKIAPAGRARAVGDATPACGPAEERTPTSAASATKSSTMRSGCSRSRSCHARPSMASR